MKTRKRQREKRVGETRREKKLNRERRETQQQKKKDNNKKARAMKPTGCAEKTVFEDFDSAWSAICEKELYPDELDLVRGSPPGPSPNSTYGIRTPKRRLSASTFMFRDVQDCVRLQKKNNSDKGVQEDAEMMFATTTSDFESVFIVGVSVYARAGSSLLESCLILSTSLDNGHHHAHQVTDEQFLRGGEHVPVFFRDFLPHTTRERADLIRRARRLVPRSRLNKRLIQNEKVREIETALGASDAGLIDLFFSDYVTASFELRRDESIDENSCSDSDESDEIAAEKEELDVFNGDDFLLLAYFRGKRDPYERSGDEISPFATHRLINVRTLEDVWLSPGHFARLCRYRRGDLLVDIKDALKKALVDIKTRREGKTDSGLIRSIELRRNARFSLCIGSGSCMSAVEALNRSPIIPSNGRRRIFICIDPHIGSLAFPEAWTHPQIVFVSCKIEHINPAHLPPEGIFRSIGNAPECSPYSIAKFPALAARIKELGEEEAALILEVEVDEANVQVRAAVDIANYLAICLWIENPKGNEKAGLWNEYSPFLGCAYDVHAISYCKYGRQYRKNTVILENWFALKLRPECAGSAMCLHKRIHDRHAEHCKFDGAARSENKIHPRLLVQSIDAQIESFYEKCFALCS